ncbi:hypothetical protein HQQ80_07710 [Microbacteriaceae bacterium VKM Ac-2855]|nr:hypothetical protein [Microbacteriaceae bacterium VKM Ac-2855]
MSNFKRLTFEELRPIVGTFHELTWPVSRMDIKALAEKLDWEITSDRRKGIDLRAALPLNENWVDVLLSDENVLKINIPVSDSVRSQDSDRERDLQSSLRTIADDVNRIVGGGMFKNVAMRRYHWDFNDSSRLAVQNIGAKIILQALSPRWANVERAEERQELDPSRPFDDHQEANG